MSAIAQILADSGLPVTAVLASLGAALEQRDEAILEAPPGAGKTTLVPLALLGQPWLAGQKILLLEPRRLAARAAAERMASLLGEKPGQTVGYRMRLETRVGPATRIEVITEGILTRMLQSDPALQGVGLVIFDEFHERNLDGDLGLALALSARGLYREQDQTLKLLVMSATLDVEGIARLLGDAPVIASEGRSYPVAVHYGGASTPGAPIEERVADTVLQVLAAQPEGSLLVFLPGEREIRQVAKRLGAKLEAAAMGSMPMILPLYGNLDAAGQRQAIEPVAAGLRKIVLATNIAETSLTIDGISIVVDGGLERVAQFDPATGMSRLHTRAISRASATQRMGRAGRLGPGDCYRLWSEQQQGQLAAQAAPEILLADLAPVALQLLAWGIDDPAELLWLDAPPAAAYQQALDLLENCGALQATSAGGWQLTRHGEAMAAMPLHPRLANMLLYAAELGLAALACKLAALLGERNPQPGAGADILQRLALLQPGVPIPRQHRGWRERVVQQERRFRQTLAAADTVPAIADKAAAAGVLLVLAFPDRVARRRAGCVYQLANGRSARLEESDPLVNHDWLAVAELGGRAGQAEDRIFGAVALDPAYFDDVLAEQVELTESISWDERQGRILAERRRMVGALQLAVSPLQQPPLAGLQAAQRDMLLACGLDALPWTEELRQWQARVALLRESLGEPWPDLGDAALLASLEQWLLPAMAGVTHPGALKKLDLATLLGQQLPWPLPRQLEQLAPRRIEVPSGSSIQVDYCQSPPVLAVKLQEMFGCETTPTVADGQVSLLVHLLSPAGRPLQVTQDLAGFWRSSYQDVKKDMKGRYPKHPWPDDPLQALPTRRVKHPRKR